MFDLILSLFVISSIVFIILLGAAAFHKEKIVNICFCILSWMTLFFLFPYVAKKYNVIKEKWVAARNRVAAGKQPVGVLSRPQKTKF